MKTDEKKLLFYTLLGTGIFLASKFLLKKKIEYDFAEKIILITGGSRGLGLTMAKMFLQKKAKVVICSRDKEDLDNAKLELLKYGKDVLTITCDVSSKSQVDEMINTIYKTFDHLDVLVNNAGNMQVGPMETMGYEDFEEALATHFWAPLHTSLAVIPKMKKKGEGRIINISSLGGKISIPHMLPYSTSKFALTGFSEGLHTELKRHNIIVTTACPALTRTGGHNFMKAKGDILHEFDWFSSAETLPLISTSAEYTAKEIIDACAAGEPEIIITLPAKLLVALHGIFPGTINSLLTIFNRFLPSYQGNGHEKDIVGTGKEISS
jgi:short-subunit dehydrogenase